MDRQKLLILAVVLLLVGGFVASFFYTVYTGQNKLKEKIVPVNSIHVPEVGEDIRASGFTSPRVVQDLTSNSFDKIRIFDIKAENGKLSSTKIAVYKNDIIRILFTGVDKKYNLSFPVFGVSQAVSEGETKTLEFQALSEGKYDFTCDTCSQNGTGSLYIVSKP